MSGSDFDQPAVHEKMQVFKDNLASTSLTVTCLSSVRLNVMTPWSRVSRKAGPLENIAGGSFAGSHAIAGKQVAWPCGATSQMAQISKKESTAFLSGRY